MWLSRRLSSKEQGEFSREGNGEKINQKNEMNKAAEPHIKKKASSKYEGGRRTEEKGKTDLPSKRYL